MPLSSDHRLLADPRLAAHVAAASALCGDARPGTLLRHVPGVRALLRVDGADGAAVLKLWAAPRARADDRRLRFLGSTDAATVVPRALGSGAGGHAALVRWTEGIVLDALAGPAFVAGMAAAGRALRRLHGSRALLDRRRDVATEHARLLAGGTPATAASVRRVVERTRALAGEPSVAAHGDVHPRHVVLAPDGSAALIGLDAATLAPAGLDIGTMVGQVRAAAAVGRRDRFDAAAGIDAFVGAYGECYGDVAGWTALALAQLAGVAPRTPEDARRVIALAGGAA